MMVGTYYSTDCGQYAGCWHVRRADRGVRATSTLVTTVVTTTIIFYPIRAPDPVAFEITRKAVLTERALLTRYGIEECARRHDSLRGAPTDHRLMRWQRRSARGFRFHQRIRDYERRL